MVAGAWEYQNSNLQKIFWNYEKIGQVYNMFYPTAFIHDGESQHSQHSEGNLKVIGEAITSFRRCLDYKATLR